MAFQNTNKIELFKSVMRFYQERLAIAAEAILPVCNILNPGPLPAGGEYFIGVAMGDGRFPLEEQAEEQLREDCDFTVMAYTRMQSDWGRRSENFLLDDKRGALALQGKLLLIVGAELMDEFGTGIIASRVFATGTIKPEYDVQNQVGWTGIRIATEFDWELPEADDVPQDS